MDAVGIVGVDGLVNGFHELPEGIKSVNLESQICLEIVEEGFLIAIFPGRRLCAHGDGDSERAHGTHIVHTGIFHALIRVNELRYC